MIKVTVTTRKAVAVPITDVTVGAVGIPVQFSFSEDWTSADPENPITKQAVFKAGNTAVDMLIQDDATIVPWEVLTTAYERLQIGVRGATGDGTIVIPTVWADAGPIQPGTELSSVDPTDPTQDWVATVELIAETAGAENAAAAAESELAAGTSALKSEGYAVGTQNGTDVSSGSPYYHNNAKYYYEELKKKTEDLVYVPATFIQGSRNSAGTLDTSYKYRVTTSDKFTVPKLISYPIPDGYQARVTSFNISTGVKIADESNVREFVTFRNDRSYVMTIRRITENTSEQADPDAMYSQIYRNVASDKHLRIVIFGHSYSADSWQYVPFMLKNYGITCEIYLYYRGNGSIDQLVSQWEDTSSTGEDAWGNSHPRRYCHIDSRYTDCWDDAYGLEGYSAKMILEEAVADGKLDLITLQTSPTEGYYLKSIGGNDPRKGYEPYVRQAIDLINASYNDSYALGWFCTYTRHLAYDGNEDEGYPPVSADTFDNQEAMLRAAESICTAEPFDMVIPAAAAVFNARTNEDLASTNISLYGNLWYSDRVHLQSGIPCYVTNATVAQSLFNKFFPGLSVYGDQFRVPNDDWITKRRCIMPSIHGSVLSTSEALYDLAQKCAISACEHPFVITTIRDPEDTTEIDFDDANSRYWELSKAIDTKGLPSGGSTNQYLIKNSSTNYDAVWGDLTEGSGNTRSGAYSHAEGAGSTASGVTAHAEGTSTASGIAAHSEGTSTTASGNYSHAEGYSSQASGQGAHAEGNSTRAVGNYSHTEGIGTKATHRSQHVFGEYNVEDDSSATAGNRGNYVEIVGNGTGGSTKSNARTLDWDGNEELAGDLTIFAGTQNEISLSDLSDVNEKIENSIAPEFDASESYSAGDYVYHNNLLLRFAKDHTGAWDAEDAEEVEPLPISDENLKKNKADIIVSSASGAIASFPDGARYLPVRNLTVAIEPVQDLHGYENPWPAGGGKNKFDVGKMVNTADITVNNGIITVTGNSKNSGKKLGELADLVVGETYTLTATTDGNDNLIYLYGTGANISWSFGTSKTITQDYLDALVFFYGGISATSHISDMMIRLSSVSDATFAPYSNICPISGWTGANVTRTGANVWDEEWELGSIDGSGNNETANDRIRSKNYIAVIPNTTYYITAPYGVWFWGYDAGKVFSARVPTSSSINNQTLTVPSGIYYLRFVVRSNYGTTYNNDISINYPSTDTSYHAYTGTTIPISWQSSAGTVYGGTLTVNEDGSCVLVKTVGYDQMTYSYLSGLSSSYIGVENVAMWNANGVWVRNWNYAEIAPRKAGGVYGKCNSFVITVHNNTVMSSQYRIYFKANSVEEFLSDVQTLENSGGGLFIAYELATPVTYNLSSITQLTTLLGTNNIWADAGDVSVEYRADTKLYIEKLTKPTEDDMTANTNITSGKFFMIGNNLYLSTQSIASGAAIVPGTNCTALSLADALNNINS